MKRHLLFVILLGFALIVVQPVHEVRAEEVVIDANPIDVINRYISEKSEVTGKYDFYDEDMNAVRNLKLIEVDESFKSADGTPEGKVLRDATFRDFNTGDVITMEFHLADADGSLVVESAQILNVAKPELSTKEDYTDDEIQKAMMDYFSLKSKYTGNFTLYHEKKGKLLKLENAEIQGDIRHFGKMHIATISMKDQDTQDVVSLDVTAKNEDGQLNIIKVKIK